MCTNELVGFWEPSATSITWPSDREPGRPVGYVTRQRALWAKQWSRVKTADSADVDRPHVTLADSIRYLCP